ncbi:hypothetical protein, partial [Nitrosomonas sp.]|uniref:hypothetical protein n=1 Tax=Nitrosomonas sp. TaxID=42353 RepID=UPI0025CCEF8C
GEFHQGPQIEIQSATRPDIRLQPILFLPKHEILLAKPGGVHIRRAISCSALMRKIATYPTCLIRNEQVERLFEVCC